MPCSCQNDVCSLCQQTNCPQVNIYKSLQDIAAGMDYLHTVGVLHGDLKGANVLLKSTATDPRGFMCKLADFGLSRVLDLDMTHISTHTYGTISYMPPELLSQGKMTRAADVYSFGMLSKCYSSKAALGQQKACSSCSSNFTFVETHAHGMGF